MNTTTACPIPVTSAASAATWPVRRLLAWSAADGLILGVNLNAALRRWGENWPSIDTNWSERAVQVDPVCAVADLVRAVDWNQTGIEGLAWSMTGPSSGDAPALRAAPRGRRRATPHATLMSALFGESIAPVSISAESRLSEQLAQDAWQDLWSEIGRLLAAPTRRGDDLTVAAAPAALVKDAIGTFSGAMLVQLPWCCLNTLNLLIEARNVPKLLARPEEAVPIAAQANAKTTSVLDALAPRRWPVRVELQPVEIDLGSLTSLSVGDVLCTAHRLDEALSVYSAASGRGDHSEVLCNAFLGRQSHWRAVELRQADVSSLN